MSDSYIPMVQLDPSEGRAVRWVGGVFGTGMFILGAFWFLAILGFVLPWYAAFPIILMFAGGFLIAAGIATRRVLKIRDR